MFGELVVDFKHYLNLSDEEFLLLLKELEYDLTQEELDHLIETEDDIALIEEIAAYLSVIKEDFRSWLVQCFEEKFSEKHVN